jgi:hypothetical protein
MRFLRTVCLSGLVGLVSAAGSVEAQVSTIIGPSLGYTPDSRGVVISPIVGVAGASLLADSLTLNAGIRQAIVSPKHNYALAIGNTNNQAVVIDLTSVDLPVIPIDGAQGPPDLLAVSPAGSTAAVFYAGSGAIQVIQGLPGSPRVTSQFDASRISGAATLLSISDDGTVAIVKFADADGPSLWALNASGSVSRLAVDQPSAVAFFVNRTDAIVSDDATRSARLLMDAGGAATQIPLASNLDGMNGFFSSLASSDDGGRVFLADASSQSVAVVDVQTGQAVVLSCGCKPEGFYRLNGNSIFRLNAASANLIMVLDASGPNPRLVVIPPRVIDDPPQEPQDKHRERKTL